VTQTMEEVEGDRLRVVRVYLMVWKMREVVAPVLLGNTPPVRKGRLGDLRVGWAHPNALERLF